ncbi:AraC family transcriptional regulator [bacterium]|nr:MAG: AraC family transcriptional regulator [bacterium]
MSSASHDVTLQSWQGVKISYHSIPPYEFQDYVAPLYSIDVNLSSSYHLEWKKGGRYQRTQMITGALCIMPAHEPLSMRWSSNLENLVADLSPSLILSTADDLKVRGEVEIRESHGQVDAQISHICQALWAECKAGYPTGRVFGESLGVALAACLLQRHGTQATTTPSGQLSPRKWKQVADFIEDNLEENIPLEELAQIVGLSPFYFTRCFKATIGTTPHQYIISRRVERARHLLSRPEASPTQVALQCGFSHQSHLTRHMKQLLGVTPASLIPRKTVSKNVL